MAYRELLSDLARPITRRLPSRRLGVVSRIAGTQVADPQWRQARRRFRTFRNRQLNAVFFVDLADWLSRWHYYGELYYDQMQLLLARQFLVGQDACYVDVGANLGVHSTTVAVATAGRCRVVAFEPNPRCYRILNTNLALNGLFDVRCHNVGLGEVDATLELSGHGDNTGMYTLRPDATADVRFSIPVRRGDDLLVDLNPTGPLLVKIDTEGYEHFVLKGMWKTLEYERAALSIEVVPEWLAAVGTSAESLFADLYARGYRSWAMEPGGTIARPAVSLNRIDQAVTETSDVFFAKPGFSAALWDAAVLKF